MFIGTDTGMVKVGDETREDSLLSKESCGYP